jgi:hypothetical protein
MKIDTSTTEGKIEVQQAFVDSKTCQFEGGGMGWINIHRREGECGWNWDSYNYRIKPQTVIEAAREDVNSEAWHTSTKQAYINGATFGAKWQKEQDNE